MNWLKQQFNRPLLWSFIIPVLILTGYFIYRGIAPFGDNTVLTVDLGQQYIDLFAQANQTLLHHPETFFYSFSRALGGGMISVWAYYLLSPLNLLLLPFTISTLPLALSFFTLIKIGLISLSLAYSFKKMNLAKGWQLTAFGIAYALSGWVVANIVNLLWLDVAILLPLILWQFERLIQTGKWIGFSFLIALLLIDNFYMAWMSGIFFIFYWIWRLSESDLPASRSRWQISLTTVWSGLLGIGMSLVVLLPTAYQLAQGKGQQTGHQFKWNFISTNAHLIFKLVPGAYSFNEMKTGSANIFLPTIFLMLAIGYLISRSTKWWPRLTAALLLIVIGSGFFWQPANLLWHAGQLPIWYPFRFSFVLILFILILAAKYLNRHLIELPVVLFNTVIFGGITIAVFLGYADIEYVNSLDAFAFLFIVLGSLLLLVTVTRKRWVVGFVLLVTAASVFNFVFSWENFSYLRNSQVQRTVKSVQKTLDKIPAQQKDFYRIGQSFQRTRGDAAAFDYFGGSYFSSTMDKTTTKLMSYFGQPEGDYFTNYSSGTLITDAVFGFKYYFTPRTTHQARLGDPVTTMTTTRFDLEAKNLFAQTAKTNLYRNPQALPLAFAASNQVKKVKLYDNDPMRNNKLFWQALTNQPAVSDFAEAQPQITLHNAKMIGRSDDLIAGTAQRINPKQPASVTLHFTPTTDDPYYLTVGPLMSPYYPKGSSHVTVNQRSVGVIRSRNHSIAMSVANEQAGQPIEVTFDFSKNQLAINDLILYKIDRAAFKQQAHELLNNSLSIKHFKQNHFDGTITTTKTKPVIMTSIPYDEGWQIKLDGRNVKPTKIAHSLIGISTKPGKHHLEMTHQPPYFLIGLIVSLTSLLIIISSWIVQHRRAKKVENQLASTKLQ